MPDLQFFVLSFGQTDAEAAPDFGTSSFVDDRRRDETSLDDVELGVI
jgi:hypothetical protein